MQDSPIPFCLKSISLRIVTALLLLGNFSAASPALGKKGHNYFAYVGTYQERGSKGIYAYRLIPAMAGFPRSVCRQKQVTLPS